MITDAHADLGSYVLGRLDADESRAFEAHLATCEACRRGVAELRPLAQGAPLPDAWTVPAGLEERVLAALQREAAGFAHEPTPTPAPTPAPAPARRRRWAPPRLIPRMAIVGAVTAVIAAIFIAGGGLRSDGDASRLATNHDHGGQDGDALPIQLAAPDGGLPHAHALVATTDSGAVVTFHSDHLPRPPAGQYYELWLVRPGDSPAHPNRVSAGRFIPDAKGTTFIDLPADASPGVIAITRERTNGDPGPSGPDIVRSDWSRRCANDAQAGCR